jgi:hypothetical protein
MATIMAHVPDLSAGLPLAIGGKEIFFYNLNAIRMERLASFRWGACKNKACHSH